MRGYSILRDKQTFYNVVCPSQRGVSSTRYWEENGQLNCFFQCVSGIEFVSVIAVASAGSVQRITELTHVVFLVL